MSDSFEYGKHVIILEIIDCIKDLEGSVDEATIYEELDNKPITELVSELGWYYEILNDK